MLFAPQIPRQWISTWLVVESLQQTLFLTLNFRLFDGVILDWYLQSNEGHQIKLVWACMQFPTNRLVQALFHVYAKWWSDKWRPKRRAHTLILRIHFAQPHNFPFTTVVVIVCSNHSSCWISIVWCIWHSENTNIWEIRFFIEENIKKVLSICCSIILLSQFRTCLDFFSA